MAGFPQVGESFGRYRITGVLGRGGMGVVFLAVQQELNRRVALKVLAPELATDIPFRHRFVREATSLASLDSPHVIHIYEYGELDGCLYLATQYVPGGDLASRIEAGGRLHPRLALEIGAQVASALEDAHRAGVVHRDVKPANVLLRDDGDPVHAYLCDFGIAQTEGEHRTRTSGLIGTLGYLAPERHEGAEASVASDVYAAGCLLWCALSGSPPYVGSDVQVAVAHVRSPVPTWPGEDPGSRSVDAIIRRSMAKRPEDRYGSAAEMRSDLLAAARHQPAADATTEDHDAGSRAATGEEQPGRRRRPVLVALAVALVGAVLGGALLAVRADDPPAGSDSPAPRADRTTGVDPGWPGSAAGVTCWTGEEADRPAGCPTPRGVSGMRWTYPSFDQDFARCEAVPDPEPVGKVRAWFCPFADNPREGVRYNEWRDASAAIAHHDSDYRPYTAGDVRQDGEPVGRLWWRRSPDEHDLVSATLSYLEWPYSATVQSSRVAGLKAGCELLETRSPTDFTVSAAGCSRA